MGKRITGRGINNRQYKADTLIPFALTSIFLSAIRLFKDIQDDLFNDICILHPELLNPAHVQEKMK